MKTRKEQIHGFILSFQEIWRFDKRLIFILIADVIINALLPFPNIIFSGLIVDNLVAGKAFSLVIFFVALMFGITFSLTAINTFLRKVREYLFIKFTNKINNDINDKCFNIDFEMFNDSSFQDRILLINQIANQNNFFTNITTVFETISRFITLVGIVLIMSMLNIWLLFIVLIVIVLQSILHSIQLKYDRRHEVNITYEQRKVGYVTQLAKNIETKKDIDMFNMRDFILKKIVFFQQTMLTYIKHRSKVSGFIEIATFSLSVAFQVSAYILIGINVFTGKISIGDFTMGIASLINFMSASSFVATNILNFYDGLFYIRRYQSFLKLRSKFDAKSNITIDGLDLSSIEIEFRNVSFRYPNSTSFVLKNINLTIKNKEKFAIVGYNGAGKTSFALLLTRMYDPTEGTILLNGIDIRTINYRDYLKIFSTVNQDFSLLPFSLLENIARNDIVTSKDSDEIVRLFHDNGMGTRLDKMYRGLDTPITKALFASGIDFSGGEMQKIAIIRALFKTAPILILDEPTAALDPVAEYEIYQKFAEMSNEKLTVYISHRIYSTRFCDRIVVFDKGEVVECGSYDELMELRGLYYEFYQKQAELVN
jgi:ABC-type multidrug transport system fused ATPase/permease subunit